MKKLATAALAIALAFSASTAMAQPEPGDCGIFGDAAGTATTLDVNPGVAFQVYAVANVDADFYAYELGFDGVPAGAFVLGSTLFGPAPLNVGDAATLNFIVGTGGCVNPGTYALVTLNILATTPVAPDTAIILRGSVPSSFDGIPGYADCDESTIATFGIATSGGADESGASYPDGALILNATGTGPVSDDADSFGGLKARF